MVAGELDYVTRHGTDVGVVRVGAHFFSDVLPVAEAILFHAVQKPEVISATKEGRRSVSYRSTNLFLKSSRVQVMTLTL